MTVHLVNLTNPMMMKGQVREVISIANQDLQVQIPDERKVARAKLLVAGRTIPHTNEQGRVRLDVPSIGVHEVVALDFVV
jgi:hypothetical protein